MVPREAVVWGYRFFLGKEPESDANIDEMSRSTDDLLGLARALVDSEDTANPKDPVSITQDDIQSPSDSLSGQNDNEASMGVCRDAVLWGYRFFLGREPESEAAIQSHRDRARILPELVQVLINSTEFRKSGRDKTIFCNKHVDQINPALSDSLYKTIPISELPNRCFLNKDARAINGLITFPISGEDKLERIKIAFIRPEHGIDPKSLVGVRITCRSLCNCTLYMTNSYQELSIGTGCTGGWIFRMWGKCNAIVGNNVSSNGVECWMNPGGLLEVGNDCMFAQAYIHVGDNHAIFDINSGDVLNYSENPVITIGEHVWVASRVTIRSNSVIGAGSILGAGSIVKGKFPDCTLVAGVPAKPVKRGVSWTRRDDGADARQVMKMLDVIRGRH